MKLLQLKFYAVLFVLFVCVSSFAQEKIYWGSEVPEKWNGVWPDSLRTISEKENFAYTANNQDILEYFAMLKWNSENVHVFNMFTSSRGRVCPVLVMANPRITSAKQAKESGKTIVYIQGGIHPSECEGKEAFLMIIRDILFGEKKYLLDELIILCCPNFNVDGNETRSISSNLPKLAGTRRNAMGYDVNRDAIKLETINMQGAYKNVFNTWDPTIIFDTHRMGRPRHGYAIVHAGSNVATANSGPRDYVTYHIFPEIIKGARKNGGIEVFYHAGLDRNWPPTEFTHDNAIWSTEGKFMASGYGLRNRMAILVETPGHESFEKMIYSQYIYTDELLKYCYKHGKEMQMICRDADEEVVNGVKELASSGELNNYVEGKYVSEGKFDILAYEKLESEYISGTSVRRTKAEAYSKPPQLISGVDLITKPEGTKEAKVPRGYLIPEDLKFIVEKLRIHNIKVDQLTESIKVKGEEFIIDKFSHERRGMGYNMTRLHGGFFDSEEKEFPAGTYILDMAQPLANVAFYSLEPEVGDGFTGWNLLDNYLISLGVEKRSIVYPIYKYFKIIE
ncbi:M14 family metallopeptidase [Bacteroidota bacterium]